mmetsp:Transcript_17881/g.45371  ORF Transcript_17881/g.45371 Transcript_17881/m.45371 type:complete len:253 (+) Transcript_17881:1551-2309(+)
MLYVGCVRAAIRVMRTQFLSSANAIATDYASKRTHRQRGITTSVRLRWDAKKRNSLYPGTTRKFLGKVSVDLQSLVMKSFLVENLFKFRARYMRNQKSHRRICKSVALQLLLKGNRLSGLPGQPHKGMRLLSAILVCATYVVVVWYRTGNRRCDGFAWPPIKETRKLSVILVYATMVALVWARTRDMRCAGIKRPPNRGMHKLSAILECAMQMAVMWTRTKRMRCGGFSRPPKQGMRLLSSILVYASTKEVV